MIARRVEPELLDVLPADDPDAVRSRRDLRVINYWMANARHLAAAIGTIPGPIRRVVELGSGDGSLWPKLLPCFREKLDLTLLDMQPVVAEPTVATLTRAGWTVRTDAVRLQEWLARPASVPYDLVIANLFMHHFTDGELREIFAHLSGVTRAFICCEPRRWAPALVTTRFLWFLGCNRVTLHDARVSVRAGFRDHELSRLWPAGVGFSLQEIPAGLASHLFLAIRRQEREERGSPGM